LKGVQEISTIGDKTYCLVRDQDQYWFIVGAETDHPTKIPVIRP